jgi:hypothetical protein
MDLVSDKEGSVTFGWVNARVFYTRFTGTLSVALGAAHVAALQAAIDSAPAISYFTDSSELDSYDLLARSALVRVLLSQRRKFTEMVVLSWAAELSPPGRALMDAIGEPLLILKDRAEFDRRLAVAAPMAIQAIRSARKRVMPTTESSLPPLRR